MRWLGSGSVAIVLGLTACGAAPRAGTTEMPALAEAIAWDDLRAWLAQLPPDAIAYRALDRCDADGGADVVPRGAHVLGESVIASRERLDALGGENVIARACPDEVNEPGIVSCVTLSGFLAAWVLRIDTHGRLVGIDEEIDESRCTLDLAALEAMVTTPATLDLSHRSIWDPNDTPDDAEPALPPRLTSDGAGRGVYDALVDVRELGACVGDVERCVSGCGHDTTCTELHMRADGSVAFLLHYDAGAPTATTTELSAWSAAERARFAAMMTLPIDATHLPLHE